MSSAQCPQFNYAMQNLVEELSSIWRNIIRTTRNRDPEQVFVDLKHPPQWVHSQSPSRNTLCVLTDQEMLSFYASEEEYRLWFGISHTGEQSVGTVNALLENWFHGKRFKVWSVLTKFPLATIGPCAKSKDRRSSIVIHGLMNANQNKWQESAHLLLLPLCNETAYHFLGCFHHLSQHPVLTSRSSKEVTRKSTRFSAQSTWLMCQTILLHVAPLD